MADLQNAQIDQSYPSLIKTFDNGPISTAGFPLITDGQGTNTMIAMSATELQLGTNINTQYFKQYANNGGNTELKDVLIRMDDATASQYFQLDAANAGMGAGANYFVATPTGNSIVGPLDLSGATVTGLPGGTAGLESGTGTDSMKSAPSLTTTPAQANGIRSIAIGENAKCTSPVGPDTIAIGTNAEAKDANAIAIGENSEAANLALAIGLNTKALSQGMALGSSANSAGLRAISIGGNSDALTTNAIALGYTAQATVQGAVALGANVTAAIADTVSVKALETQTDGGIQIKGDGTNAGKLKLYCEDAAGAHNVTLEGPAHAGGATYALKFPNVQSAGTQILEADSSGNLAWINTPSGGGGSAGLVVGTGTDSLQNAVGTASNASGAASIALGKNSTASGGQSMAYGEEALANNTSAAAFGQYAEATNTYAIAFGRTAAASGDGAVAFGQQASAAQSGAVAMGRQVTSDTADTTHVRALKIVAPDGAALGGNGITLISPDGTEGVVTLLDTDELALDGTAIGGGGGAAGLVAGTGTDSMQSAASLTSIAANANGTNSISLGNNSTAFNPSNIAIGDGANCSAQSNGIAIGKGANGYATNMIAIGENATTGAAGYRNIAIGLNATTSSGTDCIAIGKGTSVTASNGCAIGEDSSATASGAVAVGNLITAAIASTVSVNALEVQDATLGIILTAPDGGKWRMTISNTGVPVYATA